MFTDKNVADTADESSLPWQNGAYQKQTAQKDTFITRHYYHITCNVFEDFLLLL